MALQYLHASSARARRGSPTGNQRRGFAQEDLLIVATRPDNPVRYITAEVPYTGDPRDKARALKNADLVTRVTGEP